MAVTFGAIATTTSVAFLAGTAVTVAPMPVGDEKRKPVEKQIDRDAEGERTEEAP